MKNHQGKDVTRSFVDDAEVHLETKVESSIGVAQTTLNKSEKDCQNVELMTNDMTLNQVKERKDERKKNVKQFILFTLLSISAGVIDYLSGLLFNYVFHWSSVVSQYLSVALSVIWNFTFNRKFTFKSASNITVAMLKVLAFYVVFIPLSGLLTKWLCDDLNVEFALVKIITLVINFVGEFFYWKYFVFRDALKTKKSNEPDNDEQD